MLTRIHGLIHNLYHLYRWYSQNITGIHCGPSCPSKTLSNHSRHYGLMGVWGMRSWHSLLMTCPAETAEPKQLQKLRKIFPQTWMDHHHQVVERPISKLCKIVRRLQVEPIITWVKIICQLGQGYVWYGWHPWHDVRWSLGSEIKDARLGLGCEGTDFPATRRQLGRAPSISSCHPSGSGWENETSSLQSRTHATRQTYALLLTAARCC